MTVMFSRFIDTKLDMRYKSSKELARRKNLNGLLAALLLGALAGAILTKTLFDATNKTLVDPRGFGEIKVQEVLAEEPERKCDDPISYIRCSGEDLGKSNSTIMQMIRIARFESNFNPKAKNRTSSASGLFQIIAGTWYSNDCVGDKWNFKDNTDCAWKIQTQRGFTPWEVFNKGIAN